LFSAILCCCFVGTVHAQEPIPSCHQTTHQDDSAKDTQECDCDEALTVFKIEASNHFQLAQLVFLNIENFVSQLYSTSDTTVAYKSPPQIYETSSLYIKHSTLLI